MPKFNKHTFAHRNGQPVPFAPGDEVPEWAAKIVGAHVIDAASAATPAEAPTFTAADPATPEVAAGSGDGGDPAAQTAEAAASGGTGPTANAEPPAADPDAESATAAETEKAAASAATPADAPDFTAAPEKAKRGRPRKAN